MSDIKGTVFAYFVYIFLSLYYRHLFSNVLTAELNWDQSPWQDVAPDSGQVCLFNDRIRLVRDEPLKNLLTGDRVWQLTTRQIIIIIIIIIITIIILLQLIWLYPYICCILYCDSFGLYSFMYVIRYSVLRPPDRINATTNNNTHHFYTAKGP